MGRYKQKEITIEKQEFLRKIVKESTSIVEVLKKQGLRTCGGNYKNFERYKQVLGLDTSHFTGQGYLKGKSHKWALTTPDEELFIENYTGGIKTSSIRKKLLKSNHFPYECSVCKNKEWNNLPIPLELEHKNGNNTDNRLENLTLLCPNCHAQTTTYRGRNKAKST